MVRICRHLAWVAAAASFVVPIGVHPSTAAEAAAALDAALATISVEELHEHAALLADDTLEGREAGSRGGRAAARYIETKMRATGIAPGGDRGGYVQRFNPSYQNLLAHLRGSDAKLADEYIVVGAHYDHVGYGNRRNSNGPIGYIHNGADDNASGVAALLEVIDAVTRQQWQPRRSVIFAFWDGEEINLLGSRHWVRQPTVPLASVRAALHADMVGRMTGGRLEVEGTRTGYGLRQLLSSRRLPDDVHLDFTWEYKENSDHWPFFAAGIPSLLLHTGLHDDYHRPSDDLEKLNYAGIQRASAYMLQALDALANADELPKFRPASRSETPSSQRQKERPLPAVAPRLGLRWKWLAEEQPPRARASHVVPGGAAATAGVLPGDDIIAIDGQPLEVEELLPAAVLRAREEVTLEIVRAGAPQTIRVPLGGEPVAFGFSWRADDAAPGAVFVTRCIPYSPAERAGIRVHDRIYKVGGESFADEDALLEKIRAALASERQSLELEVETAGRVRSVTVDLTLPNSQSDPGL